MGRKTMVARDTKAINPLRDKGAGNGREKQESYNFPFGFLTSENVNGGYT